MNAQEVTQEHHFLEGLPPGVIYFLGKLDQKMDGITSSLDDLKARDESIQKSVNESILRETEELNKKIESSVEVIHDRINRHRTNTLLWVSAIGALLAGVATVVISIQT